MNNTLTAALAGILLFACSATPILADSTLPDAVPDDFPFPEDVSLQVQDGTSASMIQIAVSFSLKSEPANVYSTFKSYAVENGYDISREDKTEYSFSATNYGSGESIGVRVLETGSVNIVTVTFAGPNN